MKLYSKHHIVISSIITAVITILITSFITTKFTNKSITKNNDTIEQKVIEENSNEQVIQKNEQTDYGRSSCSGIIL